MSSLIIYHQSLLTHVPGHICHACCPATEDDTEHAQNQSQQNTLGSIRCNEGSLLTSALQHLSAKPFSVSLFHTAATMQSVSVPLNPEAASKALWSPNTWCVHHPFIRFVIAWRNWKLPWQGPFIIKLCREPQGKLPFCNSLSTEFTTNFSISLPALISFDLYRWVSLHSAYSSEYQHNIITPWFKISAKITYFNKHR